MNTIHVDDITNKEDQAINVATHYRQGKLYLVGDIVKYWESNIKSWIPCEDFLDVAVWLNLLQEIIRTPKEAPYVPAVGKCEGRKIGDNSEWVTCNIHFIGEKTVVISYLGVKEESQDLSEMEFRPIRTEEDKKREELLEAWKRHGGTDSAHDELNSTYPLGTFIEFLIKSGATLPESES